MQTRTASLIETAIHTVIGVVLGFVTTYAVLAIEHDPATAATWITGLMIPVSAVRQYLIRRVCARFE
jgi:hypothetical protein